MSNWVIGVIGGSGLYDLEGLTGQTWSTIDTPWGAPSESILEGYLNGVRLVFLPRHGRGHRIAPHEINARANIDALKRAGCTDIVSISAVGSLNEQLAPGKFAVARQYVDRTRLRPASFFGDGIVAHVSMADPVCPRLSQLIIEAGAALGFTVADGATYLAIEGPQFSTRAESRLYRQWGCDVIGMTAMPEARLAREAELPYANLCMITDYDCWRSDDASVDVPSVLAVMRANADKAKQLLSVFVTQLPHHRPPSAIDTVLDTAIVTDPNVWSVVARGNLDAIAGRRLRPAAAKPST